MITVMRSRRRRIERGCWCRGREGVEFLCIGNFGDGCAGASDEMSLSPFPVMLEDYECEERREGEGRAIRSEKRSMLDHKTEVKISYGDRPCEGCGDGVEKKRTGFANFKAQCRLCSRCGHQGAVRLREEDSGMRNSALSWVRGRSSHVSDSGEK